MLIDNDDNTEFEDFLDEYNFNLAWYRLQRSTRYKVKHRLGLDVYAPQKEQHIQILREKLLGGEYKPENAENLYEPKRKGNRRFAFLTMDDRLVYQAIGNHIIKNSYDTIENLANEKRIYANIPQSPDKLGNWSYYTFKRVFATTFDNTIISGQYDLFVNEVIKTSNKIREQYPDSVLLRTDIANFYPTINHEKLIDILKKNNWLKSYELEKLLRQCLLKWREKKHYKRGLPIGYETSDYLANLYLLPLDEKLRQNTHCLSIIRYVDDIYIFVDKTSNVKNVIDEFDYFVENELSLERSETKTNSYPLKDTPEEEIKRDVRVNLSHLVDAHEVPEKQDDLLKLFNEFFVGTNGSNCSKRVDNESVISFVLYRLNQRSDEAYEAVFCLLDEYPRYSRQAVKYLIRNNYDDEYTIYKLQEKLFETKHWQVKIQILDALKELGFTNFAEEFILQTNCETWDYQYHILDLLPQDDNKYYDFYLNIVQGSDNYLVEAKALRQAFERTDNIDEKIQLINMAFEHPHNFIKILGTYFWRLQNNVHRNVLNIQELNELQIYLLSGKYKSLRQNFIEIFGEISNDEFPLEKFLKPSSESENLLVIINDRKGEDKMELYHVVDSLHRLSEIFLLNVARDRHDNIRDLSLDEIIDEYFPEDGSRENTAFLRDWYKKIQNDELPHPRERITFLKYATNFFEEHLNYLHTERGLSMPTEQSFDVFVSYHHDDMDEVIHFCKQLKSRDVKVWRDKEQSKFGSIWKNDLSEGLTCEIGLVCVGGSGIGPWQLMEYYNFLNKAIKNEKLLIPILLESAPDNHDELPIFMEEFNWFDLRKNDMKELVNQIISRRT